jgi:hypothetical protein
MVNLIICFRFTLILIYKFQRFSVLPQPLNAPSVNFDSNHLVTPDQKPGCFLGKRQALRSRLDVVAPGSDTGSPALLGGMLTAGGTFVDGFWQSIRIPGAGW